MVAVNFEPTWAQIGQSSLAIDSLNITAPPGAVDNVLSTDQQFTLETEIAFENVDDLEAEVVLPEGFLVVGGNEKQSLNQPEPKATARWLLQAPASATSGFIRVNVSGNDGRVVFPNEISAEPDSIFVTVVEKARLEFEAEISGPESARDRQLSVRQKFTLEASLRNLGQAALVGHDSVRLELPQRYGTSDPLSRKLEPRAGGVVWEIVAPDQPTGVSDIVIELKQLSHDENSNQIPVSNQETIVVAVTTAPLSLNTTPLTERYKNVAARGQSGVSLLGLEFVNESDSYIRILEMQMHLRNQAEGELSPSSVLSRMVVVDYFDPATHLAKLSQLGTNNPIQVRFDPPVRMGPSQTTALEFKGDLLTQTEVSSFKLAIDSPQENINAQDESGNRVEIQDGLDQVITNRLTSGLITLVDSGLQASFFNAPNPFIVSQQGLTKFVYNLPKDSDISLSIYTLLGELVWSRSFQATEIPATAGLHDEVTWSGENDVGQSVVSGVYVAVLNTNAGKAMTKIAVVK